MIYGVQGFKRKNWVYYNVVNVLPVDSLAPDCFFWGGGGFRIYVESNVEIFHVRSFPLLQG